MFITDVEGQIVFKDNITSEIPSDILDIISSYLGTKDSYIPLEFHLEQNYPNPFNGRTNINFSLPFSAYVDLKIFDMNGEVVKTLYQGYRNNEQSKIIWDGKNDFNNLVSSGVYLYSIESLGSVKTKKLTFIK
ncbi:MAG: T9SS type A sorting domain-containing protein [Candidatus Neomarinimicrobiota bacterium]